MEIEIRDLQDSPANAVQIQQVLQAGAAAMNAQLDWLSVALVDDSRMADLNRRFLDRSGTTDIIAFEAEDDADGRGGEIIISVQTAQCQAQEYGHSLIEELCLLAVHGLLHVLGYEDASPEGRAEMERIQQKLMPETYPRE